MKRFTSYPRGPYLCLVAVLVLTVGDVLAHSTLVYGSQGFESPEYATGNLVGQNSWLAIGGASGSATVQDSVVAGGSQAVMVSRAVDSDGRWTPGFTELDGPGSLLVEWDMRITSSNNPGFGPYFGVEVYDDNNTGGSPTGLIGALFVDAATGDVLYDDAGGFGDTGEDVLFDEWNAYSILFDFQALTYTIGLNGTPLEVVAFSDGTGLSHVSTVELIALGDYDSPSATGSAYIDNMTITQNIPEPTSLAILLGLGAIWVHRRRSAFVSPL